MKRDNNIIEMRNVSKRFGGTKALDNVNFSVEKGSIHALLGENGAGKSTLMKILSGVYSKDDGQIFLDGEEVNIQSYSHSQTIGIALVPQELSLVQYFTVGENIFLGREPKYKGTNLINWKKLYKDTETLLKDLNIKLSAKTVVNDLSVSEQQMVIIAKVLSLNAKVIIMDEPTARLGHQEVEKLLDYVKYLKSEGISIIYISHHLEEIYKVCDEITVLRDGKTVGTKKTTEVKIEELINLMVNREFSSAIKKVSNEQTNTDKNEEVLRVENLSNARVKDINFSVGRGEILGISGLVGAGRTEMVRALLGIDKRNSGDIFLEGKKIKLNDMSDAVDAGLVLVPEERRKQGVVLDLSIRSNISLGNLSSFCVGPFLNQKKERQVAKDLIKKLRVRTGSAEQLVSNLSGGNQQKVVLAKWMSRPVKVFILDEPTRGIDVGSKGEIYQLINDLAKEGTAVVMISSEIPEIQAVCDRVLVMKEGKITGELTSEELEADKILSYAIEG
ncbi:sugar ABC transporter ATP-binding protein [Evansella cellulosilytica]|uniref:ABC transporter related protein n=1 Tax=Evansella cellulosilytica (strain ATCC 21833 / DSM 2522 / FERM P-1141 / JCM 9156 / N-4) TaxID=649639 RepID=E6TTV3_EVAC2|nr:sugar ABC transporter ATP-binding protein [Evansella cellulosilytica]ADU31984.1 ABC transporter related protein [Evansella cellulosilytica DSM 2522]